jgi:putrescine aminotransferase
MERQSNDEKDNLLLAVPSTPGELAAQALQLVHLPARLTTRQADRIAAETVQCWREHVNAGFLTYRRSMGDGTVATTRVDWADSVPGSSWFQDAHGRLYLDCLSGFGIFNVGHRHPVVLAAVTAQLKKQALHSQELLDPLRAYTARLMAAITPGGGALSHTFFVNSGTEAVEAALKLAILHTGRSKVLACINAFHGKTLGALATTSKAAFRAPFLSSLLDVSHLPFNDVGALASAFEAATFTGDAIACLILEPVQGEGGVHVATDEYMLAARELCSRHGACLVLDEVQTGFGRTGKWFACEWAGVIPDLLCVGKSMSGGVVPVAACCGTAAVWAKYVDNPFLFTSTFGGNPLALSAVIATINVIMTEGLLYAAQVRGKQMKTGLLELQAQYPDIVRDVRGRGLMLAVEFLCNDFGVRWSKRLLDRHVLVSGTLVSATTVRVSPPLVITEQEVTHALQEMDAALAVVRLQIQNGTTTTTTMTTTTALPQARL